jgi:hypothetical protein
MGQVEETPSPKRLLRDATFLEALRPSLHAVKGAAPRQEAVSLCVSYEFLDVWSG